MRRICTLPPLLALLFEPAFAGTNEASYEILENGAGKFKVEISGPGGPPIPLDEVTAVSFDDIVVDYQPAANDDPQRDPAPQETQYRLFEPGDAHFGNITLRVSPEASKGELYQWWLDTSAGHNIRRNISVIALKRDGSEARRWNVFDATPIRCTTQGKPRDSDAGACETVVAKMGRVELQSANDGTGYPPDPGVYAALLTDLFPGTLGAPWAEWIDGTELLVAPVPGSGVGTSQFHTSTPGHKSVGADQFHTSTPGHKSVDELTLTGPLTSGRRALSDWLTFWSRGRPLRAKVVIKEITKDGADGKSYHYLECIPTRYVFPAFDATGSGSLEERFSLKAERIEG